MRFGRSQVSFAKLFASDLGFLGNPCLSILFCGDRYLGVMVQVRYHGIVNVPFLRHLFLLDRVARALFMDLFGMISLVQREFWECDVIC